MIRLLGTMSDVELSKRVGIPKSTLSSKRAVLGIPPVTKVVKKTRWTPKLIRKLGTISDQALAKELGVSSSVVQSRRQSLNISSCNDGYAARRPWTKSEIDLLGKFSDVQLQKKLGRGRRHIRAMRESLGIPPVQKRTLVEWTPAMIRRLGKEPDTKLAEEFGVSFTTVALKRRSIERKQRDRTGKRK
ncbi:MAG: hypothetical protein U0996_16775 [Planctomycetaceae bacterium]